MIRRLMVASMLALLGCTGDELPPPTSPRDPASPNAPEARVEATPSVLASGAAAASAPPASASPPPSPASSARKPK